MSDECRYPKCDVCGADARADATPRTEVGETVKRWLVRQALLVDFDKHPGGAGWERVVLASDYNAVEAERDDEKAKHLVTIKKLAEMWADRDRLAAECEGLEAENKRFVQDRNDAQAWSRVYRADAEKYVAERDALAAQVELLRGELKAAEDGSGITNVVEQMQAQIDAETRYSKALAATVERVSKVCLDMPEADSLRKYWQSALASALAEPVEATFPRCRECGKWKQP